MLPPLASFAGATLVATAVLAQQQYPEGAAIPRNLTAAESAWLSAHPLVGTDTPTPPPTGPVRCPGEYEPAAGLCIAWEGSAGWTAILTQIARHVTTTGQARIWCYVDSTSERTSVAATLAAAGCAMGSVQFLVRTTDTIWMRDYGPRYIYEGGCRAIVDHTYNRPRPNDDAVPAHFGTALGHRVYEIPLVHGGGNFHLSTLGDGDATMLIANENPTLSTAQIQAHWLAYQNLAVTIRPAFPTSIDSTQHIDMWMQICGDRTVMISDWPLNPGSAQDQICDATAIAMAAAGYAVHRVPAFSVGGVHYTYTNMVLCNGLALVPSYTNATVAPYNAQALGAWQTALQNHTIVPIDCQAIVTAAGVMHCIVMHVPAALGGAVPTAYLQSQNGGEQLVPQSTVDIRWNADDDEAVTGVDVLLSVNGGASFPYLLAQNAPHTGVLSWTVPDLHAPHARIRVVARDAQGRTGSDTSDADFAILGNGCRAESLAYGSGKPGLGGMPALGSDDPVLAAICTVELDQALPNAAFLLLLGSQPAALPFDGGTLLVAATSGFVAATDAQGQWQLLVAMPDEPALCGVQLHAQAWIPGDPGAAGAGWAASNGLRLTLGH